MKDGPFTCSQLADMIEKYRDGMTEREFANRCGVSQGTISCILTRKPRGVSRKTVAIIAFRLGLNVELFDWRKQCQSKD